MRTLRRICGRAAGEPGSASLGGGRRNRYGNRYGDSLFSMSLLCHLCNADLEDEDLDEDMGGGGRAAGEPGSASPGGGRRNRYDDFGGDLSDEMDDFIVDGEDGDRRRARRRRDARVAQAAGLSTAAVQVRHVDIRPAHSRLNPLWGGGGVLNYSAAAFHILMSVAYPLSCCQPSFLQAA
jgi:hypothetical protein